MDWNHRFTGGDLVPIRPSVQAAYRCPYCAKEMRPDSFDLVGTRTLAGVSCPTCAIDFYADLPTGHGLTIPFLLEPDRGIVHGVHPRKEWFRDWLLTSWADPDERVHEVRIEQRHPVTRPALLNCIDWVYGHSLLKLLNAQYFIDKHPEVDLVVIVQAPIEWLVPDGVAEVWSVDLPFREAKLWSRWLAEFVNRKLDDYESAFLCSALPHPHPQDVDISRFTSVPRFDPSRVGSRGHTHVTFVWREDRVWAPELCSSKLSHRVTRRINRWAQSVFGKTLQRRRLVKLAANLIDALPQARVSLIGIGKPCRMHDVIADLRTPEPTEADEMLWCTVAADSDVVVGVHGSHMLLPSGHAGATVEFVPRERWGNIVQDLILSPSGVRETLFRYRHLPLNTGVCTAASAIRDLILASPSMMSNFGIASPREHP